MPVSDRNLRPMERRMIMARDSGMGLDEISRRFGKSRRQVQRILSWVEIPRRGRPERTGPSPLATRVVAMRERGIDHDEIARRFKRSTRFIRQVEGLAHVRFGTDAQTFAYGMNLLKASGREARAAAARRANTRTT